MPIDTNWSPRPMLSSMSNPAWDAIPSMPSRIQELILSMGSMNLPYIDAMASATWLAISDSLSPSITSASRVRDIISISGPMIGSRSSSTFSMASLAMVQLGW